MYIPSLLTVNLIAFSGATPTICGSNPEKKKEKKEINNIKKPQNDQVVNGFIILIQGLVESLAVHQESGSGTHV